MQPKKRGRASITSRNNERDQRGEISFWDLQPRVARTKPDPLEVTGLGGGTEWDTSGGQQGSACGGATVDGLRRLLILLSLPERSLSGLVVKERRGWPDKRWKEVLRRDYFGTGSDHIPHISLSPWLMCSHEVYHALFDSPPSHPVTHCSQFSQ